MRDLDRMSIRDAAAADAAAIASIYNESIRAGSGTMVTTLRSAEDIRRRMDGFGRREGFLVLERDGDVVAWGVIKLYSPRTGYDRCAETSVFVRASDIGRGHGTRLKRALIERCREYGYHHLIARVWADNEASIAYNLKLGYELVGVQREIGYVGGRWRDVAILQLVLEDVGPEVAERYL